MSEIHPLSEKIRQFLSRPDLITPFLVIDLDCVAQQFHTLQNFLPDTEIYYAVAANPELAVLQRLIELGVQLSVTSVFEIQRCLVAGAAPSAIVYSVQTGQGVAQAYAMGVRQFTFAHRAQLEKIAIDAPESQVCCRVSIPVLGSGSSKPAIAGTVSIERHLEVAQTLLLDSLSFGLQPRGMLLDLAVDEGQQAKPSQWSEGAESIAQCFSRLAQQGVELQQLSLEYSRASLAAIFSEQQQVKTLTQAVARHLHSRSPKIALEIGQALVANAGVLQSEVVLIAHRAQTTQERWVYLDVGKLEGQPEAYNTISYPIRTPHDGGEVGPAVLAGATVEVIPRLHRHPSYQLPLSLKVGDRVEILSTGAYCHTNAAESLNGFPPVKVYCI
jgi:ornithine decarboxylase